MLLLVSLLMISQVITTIIYYDVVLSRNIKFDLEEDLNWLYLVEGVSLALCPHRS